LPDAPFGFGGEGAGGWIVSVDDLGAPAAISRPSIIYRPDCLLTRVHGEPTDVAYLRLTHQLAAAGATWSMAIHESRLRETVHLALGPVPVEQLHGVRPEILDDLRPRGIPTRVYLPYGPDWFRYWLRRIAESRGA
jgi:hypothetical protein